MKHKIEQGMAATVHFGSVAWKGAVEAVERYPSGAVVVHVHGGSPRWRVSVRSRRGGPWHEVWFGERTHRYIAIGPARLELESNQ